MNNSALSRAQQFVGAAALICASICASTTAALLIPDGTIDPVINAVSGAVTSAKNKVLQKSSPYTFTPGNMKACADKYVKAGGDPYSGSADVLGNTCYERTFDDTSWTFNRADRHVSITVPLKPVDRPSDPEYAEFNTGGVAQADIDIGGGNRLRMNIDQKGNVRASMRDDEINQYGRTPVHHGNEGLNAEAIRTAKMAVQARHALGLGDSK